MDEATTCTYCGRNRAWADDPDYDGFWQRFPLPYARYYATGGEGSCLPCYFGVGLKDFPEQYEGATT